MNRYSSYILFLLVTVLVVTLYVNDFGPMANLQVSVDDFLSRLTASSDTRKNVVIVSIDARSQGELGAWPWNYDLIADLLAATATGEPKTIAVDFVMSEDSRQDSAGYTDILAGQLSWIDYAVLPYDIAATSFRSNVTNNPKYLFDFSITVDNPLGLMAEKSSLQVRKVFYPAEKILASHPNLGFDYIMPDADKVLRHQSLVMNFEGYYYPSMSLMAAAVYLDVAPDQIKIVEGESIQLGGKRTIPINDRSEYFIQFPKDNSFKTYSAAQILSEDFDMSVLKDKMVLVTADDKSSGQGFKTPVQEQTPRSAIKATVLENIINRNFYTVKDDMTMLNLLLLFGIGAICAFVLPQVSTMYRFVILGAALIILVNVNYFLFSSFKIIAETVYFGLELVLFLAISPVLDSAFITGDLRERRPSLKTKKVKAVSSPKEDASNEQIPVRQLVHDANDPHDKKTTAIASRDDLFPDDYQALQLDDPVGHTVGASNTMAHNQDAKTSAVTARKSSKPEIIVPDELPEEASSRKSSEPTPDSGRQEITMSADDITHLGRYQVTGILGRGAMGQVYKGIDPAINRPVALKTIRLDFVNDPEEMAELKERLFREAQAAGKLSHPNIVVIYDVGSEGHLQYIAMEYLEGQTLEEMIKKKTKFNYKIIAQIITQVCSALEYAHERGIVHRDIKPANIMILQDYRVKVMDYGIARIDSNSMTKTGIAMGTPNYIAPEQLQGKSVDKRADIFSLGVVMYEMLMGKRPFKGENITSLIYSILHHDPDKPSNANPQIPLLFDHIVGKALKKNPAERYQKASDIVVDLHDFVESFVS